MLEMIYAFLLIDGLRWYALSILFLIGTVVCIEWKYPARSTLGLIASLAVLQLTPLHPITVIMDNPLLAVEYTAMYIGAGIVYVFIRWIWYSFCISRKANRIKDEAFEYFLKDVKSNSSPSSYFNAGVPNVISSLNEYGRTLFFSKISYKLGLQKSIPLQVREHISELYIWWSTWPLCIVWSILSFIHLGKLWNVLFEIIHTPLQRISDKLHNMFFKLT